MDLNLDWTEDPLVKLEDQIVPSLWMISDFAFAPRDAIELQTVKSQVDRAVELLKTYGAQYLAPTGVEIDAKHHSTLSDTGRLLEAAFRNAQNLHDRPDQIDGKSHFLHEMQHTVRPAVKAAIDLFRQAFITMVLDRQSRHANLSQESLADLDVISKKIFLVAINASVEAARIGDAGAGFSYISQEIRNLSQDAQNAIEKLHMN